MKSWDNEEKLMMFSSVENMLLRKNIPVNETLIYRVRQAEDFFNESVESIESIIDERRPYKFNPTNIKEMLKFIGYSFARCQNDEEGVKKMKSELGHAISDFRKYITRFQELEEEPKRFFSDESKIRDVYGISNKMKNFYQRLVDEEYLHELTTPDD